MPDLAPTLGLIAGAWISDNCTQGPGDHEDEMFHLTGDQLNFLINAYELDPDSGRRRYRRAALVRGKGHGKSTLAAAIALFEALGPARFSHWDEDGQPVGKRVMHPQIRCLATAEDQTSNVYDAVIHMATHGPIADLGLDTGMTRIILPEGGVIKPVTASASARDGGRETFVVADESHLWQLPEMHRLHQTMVRNLAKRHASQAWLMEATTAFRPGEGSVAENSMSYGLKIAAGEAIDWHFYYDHRQVPNTYDLTDPVQRMDALLESYGDAAGHVDLEQASRLWDDPQTDPVDWRRYWLSQIVTSADSFLDIEEWAGLADATRSLHDGDTVCLGLDTSIIDDGTALVAARLSDGHVERLGYWQKPTGRAGLGWSVPYDEVDSTMRGAFDRFKVLRLYCDPQYVHSYLDAWSLSYGSDRCYSWPTNRPLAMSAALQRLFVAVRTKEISHDGDTLLAQHVGNARTYMSQGRVLVRKEAHHSSKKIDLLIALTLAVEAAADAHSAGEDVVVEVKRRAWSF